MQQFGVRKISSPPATASYYKDAIKLVNKSQGATKLIDIMKKRESNLTPTQSILANRNHTYEIKQKLNSTMPTSFERNKTRSIRITRTDQPEPSEDQ